MAKIENLQTTLALSFNEDKTPVFAGYMDLIKICINKAPVQGLSVADMRERFRIVDMIDNISDNKGELEFTKEQTAIIKNAVATFRWAQPHRDVVSFGEYIEKLQ